MDEMIEILGRIAESIGGAWKDLVLLDNPNNNDLVDAFNQGVRAMASQACGYVQAIKMGKQIEKKQKEFGTIFFPEKEGGQ